MLHLFRQIGVAFEAQVVGPLDGIASAPQIEVHVRWNMHSRIPAGDDRVELEAAFDIRLHVTLQTRMSDAAVGRVIAVLVGVVRIDDGTRYGVLAVWSKDAARDNQGIAWLTR